MKKDIFLFVILIIFYNCTAFADVVFVPKVVHVNGPYVLLIDVFKGITSKSIAKKVLMKAPAPGNSFTVSAGWLEQVACLNRIVWKAKNINQNIVIQRDGKKIDLQIIQHFINKEIEKQLRLNSLSNNQEKYIVQINNLKNIFLPITINESSDLIVDQFIFNQILGTFRITFRVLHDSNLINPIGPIVGSVQHMLPIIIPIHKIMPGDVISNNDIQIKWVRDNMVLPMMFNCKSNIIGKTPKFPLQADKPILMSQIQTPFLVKRNDFVTIIYQNGLLHLSTIGKALSSGSFGDQVSVLNISSHKKITGIIRGKKTIEVHSS